MGIFRSSSPQPNPSGVAVAAADQLTGPNIDRLLAITENSTSLLHSLSKTLNVQQHAQPSSGVEVLESEQHVLPALQDTAETEVTETDSKEEKDKRQMDAEAHANCIEMRTASAPNLSSSDPAAIILKTSVSELKVDKNDDLSSDDDIVILGKFDEDDDDFDNCRL